MEQWIGFLAEKLVRRWTNSGQRCFCIIEMSFFGHEITACFFHFDHFRCSDNSKQNILTPKINWPTTVIIVIHRWLASKWIQIDPLIRINGFQRISYFGRARSANHSNVVADIRNCRLFPIVRMELNLMMDQTWAQTTTKHKQHNHSNL